MKDLFKYIFVCVSLYLCLKFVSENPDSVTEFKQWVDSSAKYIAKEAKSIFNKEA